MVSSFRPTTCRTFNGTAAKKSVTLNLKSEKGVAILRRLAAGATVVIDGLRAGAAVRLGLGYDDVVALNPTVVYCSLNGMGSYGPYAKLPTHGLSFDCFAGLNLPLIQADGTPRLSTGATGTTGVLAGPLYAAMAVLAALHSTRRDGRPQYVEVSQVDAAIAWNFQKLTAHANNLFGYSDGAFASLRYQYYETSDGNYVVFNALEDKFWQRFCEAVERRDLYEPDGRVWATIRKPTNTCAVSSLRSSRAGLVVTGLNSSSPPISRVHRPSRAATYLTTNTSKHAAWCMNRQPRTGRLCG